MSIKLAEAGLRIHCELATSILTRFIRNEIHRTGFRRAVVGLSGGIDSSVTTYLAARALGAENVLAVTMPYKTSSQATRNDSCQVIEHLGVRTANVPITAQVDAYFAMFPDAVADASGQQMRSRADDHPLRPKRLVRRLGARNE